MSVLRAIDRWVRTRDQGLWAVRRAFRTAIVMPALFALSLEVFHNATMAPFAAFGSFAMLLLVDFTGSRSERVVSVFWLAIAGGALVSIATLCSRTPWLAAVTMALVGFVVLQAGVISSVLAAASTSLLLAYVLPVATAAPASAIPSRLAGWLLAGGVAMVAVATLWPAPPRDPLRGPAGDSCRALAAWLRATVTAREDPSPAHEQARRDALAQAHAADDRMRSVFYSSPSRPTGLETSTRMLVRLVDELGWLTRSLDLLTDGSGTNDAGAARPYRSYPPAFGRAVAPVKLAAAEVLELGAQLLDGASSTADLQAALGRLDAAVRQMQHATTGPRATDSLARRSDAEVLAELAPTFTAQEVAFMVRTVGTNLLRTVRAERRTWWERLLGRQPDGAGGTLASARDRILTHLRPQSVWLHNSVRAAAGLGVAVLIADLTAVQHSFWIVLGTLSVLRSNALGTGQRAVESLLGTTGGIVLGAAIVIPLGNDTTALWAILPVCIVLAGFAPAAISFTAGQAAFTLTLVILFNIISPVGVTIGVTRIEDIAIGCGVSLVVGLLFWPRGAGASLRASLREAYRANATYLGDVVDFGVHRRGGDPGATMPVQAARHAAAASRRLDDAFREYLTERSGKRMALPEVTSLVSGIVPPRLVGDALLDLWQHDPNDGTAPQAALSRLTRASDDLVAWYARFADSLTGRTTTPPPDAADPALGDGLVGALRDGTDAVTAVTVRVVWTADHLDALRRLEPSLSRTGGAAAQITRSPRAGDEASGRRG